jgi:hypothetical protein
LAGLNGVSGGVPFVFTEFDWRDAATQLNLATVKTQAPATADRGRAISKTLRLSSSPYYLPALANPNVDAASASLVW